MIIVVHVLFIGIIFVPNAYTLDGVVAVNGSNADGGCPSECVGMSGVLKGVFNQVVKLEGSGIFYI